ncbi:MULTISPECIES: SDR family NAD(P)-dependent oxidoreductase [Roseobacteraceae]|uniref:Dihydroanticapsin 7-dehydrogenase n=1 Tax=Pseudosulfitobacter pseudonitzschiae TaxID=1402135 RepID=A0A221K7L0_9RHOB|nr:MULTISPECIES: SDR family NAD(P)-dependent oxidoreductase [Roseobacteraceae]ASM74991.1 dihydroanticapsin 7-dehydrogenase [Pseudosulfitobacter pseudonitzschiae]
MTDITGKVAIITGAASGIGRAAVQMFADAGAAVIACDRDPGVSDVVAEITGGGGRAVAMEMDAGNDTDIKAAVDLAETEFGRLDIFFANAGISGGPALDFTDATPEQWAEVLRINLIGPFLAIKHAAPAMKRQGGGSIVVTASIAGLRAGSGPPAYSASKAGVINLVKSAAQGMAETNIRVNAICPGLIETGMTKRFYDMARATGNLDKMGILNPQRRGGTSAEVASVALFLSSDLASYVNGEAIVVDGGLTSANPHTKRDPEAVKAAMEALERQKAG